LRDVRFDSAGNPVYAMMVTGKDAYHRPFATNAIISFLAQTYGNRHLVIVNDGDYEFEVAGIAADRILQIQVDRKLRLGALRNLALDRIPPQAVWVQWDDDDWHHPALIAEQHDVLTSRGVDACFLRRQIKYAFARNAAWSDMYPGGFAGTLMTRNFPEVRYPDVARSEDSAYGFAIQQRYRHCDWDNPAEYYIRFIHGHNTWPDSHFALASRQPNEWRMSLESADYLRSTLPLYEQAIGGPRAEPSPSGSPRRLR
jgi:glycosyltransferase involved in cell wall biosynthesis